MSLETMDDLGKGGTILALIGGVLGIVPELERLLYFGPDWEGALLMALLAAGVLSGAILAINGFEALGGILAGVIGFPVLVFGPTTAGTLGVLGGILLFVAAGREGSPTDGTFRAS